MAFKITNLINQFRGFFHMLSGLVMDGQTDDNEAVSGAAVVFYRSDAKRLRFQDSDGNLHSLATEEAPDTRTGPGAVSIATRTTQLVTTGADALTIADGIRAGQRKSIVMKTDGGAGTLTPATPSGFATLTFDDVRDMAELEWTGAAWIIIAATATVA